VHHTLELATACYSLSLIIKPGTARKLYQQLKLPYE